MQLQLQQQSVDCCAEETAPPISLLSSSAPCSAVGVGIPIVVERLVSHRPSCRRLRWRLGWCLGWRRAPCLPSPPPSISSSSLELPNVGVWVVVMRLVPRLRSRPSCGRRRRRRSSPPLASASCVSSFSAIASIFSSSSSELPAIGTGVFVVVIPISSSLSLERPILPVPSASTVNHRLSTAPNSNQPPPTAATQTYLLPQNATPC
jgi:hypothetical protein